MISFGPKTNFKFVEHTNDAYIISWGYTPMKTVETVTKRNTTFETGKIIESTTEGTWESISIPSKGKLPKTYIQNKVREYINSKTAIEISKFTWKNYDIDLSETDQINYTALYNLVCTTDNVLPICCKFSENSSIIYYEFTSVDEYTDFYKTMVKHIHSCLKAGWDEQNAINWDDYKI